MSAELIQYGELLTQIKSRIQQAQVKASLSVNAEMILMYWDVGRMIHARQQGKGWGAAVIPRLSKDILNELPEVKGFSERNLKRMTQFYREYPGLVGIGPRAVAQLSWAHIISPYCILQCTSKIAPSSLTPPLKIRGGEGAL